MRTTATLRKTALFAFAVLFLSTTGAHAAVLFSENFEGYSPGGVVTGTNGWVGGKINTKSSASFGANTVLDGTDFPVTVDGFALVKRQFGNLKGAGNVYEFSVDVFGQTFSLRSHDAAMGPGSSAGSTLARDGTHWTVLYDKDNVPGKTGFLLDAHGITGNASAFVPQDRPFDQIDVLKIIIDRNSSEVYGALDFGSGLVETSRVAVSTSQIAAIDSVFGFTDFRSANIGGSFASTALGTRSGGAQWDNILVTDDSVEVPEPGSLAVFGLGLLGLGFLRRRRP